MIGSEVSEALKGSKSGKISVVGHTALAQNYQRALELFGVESTLVTPALATGFSRVAHML
ncbi:2-keto-3-deoxy-galactonokinase [compost metagenome]